MKFTWNFPQFVVNPQQNNLKNVVVVINWICTGTDGTNTSSASGSVKLGEPNPAEFIPYQDITQEMAASWVASLISVPGVEAQIAAQIAALSIPVIQSQSPPFNT
jgi:hypothetical protein